MIEFGSVDDMIHAIETVTSQIEDTFASVGRQLGRGQDAFQTLHKDLGELVGEFAGADIENAATACQAIAERLDGLAETLAAENTLLRSIGGSTADASEALRPLVKLIQVVMTIARSARIEAAALGRADQAGLLDFVEEASDLTKNVQKSLETSIRDQEHLLAALRTASAHQGNFTATFGDELRSIASELKQAHIEIENRQQRGADLTRTVGGRAGELVVDVGRAIVSLQAGDSARQRAEHICLGLRLSAGVNPVERSECVALMGALQAVQLDNMIGEITADMALIVSALEALAREASEGLARGLTLYSDDSSASSFFAKLRRSLKRAATLMAMCERERQRAVESLAAVEEMLGRFRSAITELADTVSDITLIGMNAGLRASHLGAKGSTFVVIANELKASADRIAQGITALKPLVEQIEDSATTLRNHRAGGESHAIGEVGPLILGSIERLSSGNERLGRLVANLESRGRAFEGSTSSSSRRMAELLDHVNGLHVIVSHLQEAGLKRGAGIDLSKLEPLFLSLYANYTMNQERKIYSEFARKVGFTKFLEAERKDEMALEDFLF